MEGHATVFYISGKGYALAYDRDFDELQEYDREEQERFRLFCLCATRNRDSDLCYMSITYYEGEEGNRVDRCVLVTPRWLARVLMQFEEAYPNGIPDSVLLSNFTQTHAGVTRYPKPERVSKEVMEALMGMSDSARIRQKKLRRKSRSKGLSAYI